MEEPKRITNSVPIKALTSNVQLCVAQASTVRSRAMCSETACVMVDTLLQAKTPCTPRSPYTLCLAYDFNRTSAHDWSYFHHWTPEKIGWHPIRCWYTFQWCDNITYTHALFSSRMSTKDTKIWRRRTSNSPRSPHVACAHRSRKMNRNWNTRLLSFLYVAQEPN